MNKLYFYILVWIIGILGLMALKHCIFSEPDFEAMIEANPTAAGEKRPSYFKVK